MEDRERQLKPTDVEATMTHGVWGDELPETRSAESVPRAWRQEDMANILLTNV